MKAHIHRLLSQQALDLFPDGPVQAFFNKDYGGKSAIELIQDGSHDEDFVNDGKDPLGVPVNQYDMDGVDDFIESLGDLPLSLIPSGAAEDFVSYVQDGSVPWLEHYWNHKFRLYGLTKPYGANMVYFAAWKKAERYWDRYVVGNWPDNKADALYYLGRVVHLLQDMGVPAHVNNDPHANLADFFDTDEYENFTGYIGEEDRERIGLPWKNNDDNRYIFYNPEWSILDFFKEIGSKAALYDSDDYEGTGYDLPYRWPFFLMERGQAFGRDIWGDLTEYACNTIAYNLVPLTLSFTAGLYLKFLKDIGEPLPALYYLNIRLDRIRIHDDQDTFAEGEITLNIDPFDDQISLGEIKSGRVRKIDKIYSLVVDKDYDLHLSFSALDEDLIWDDSLGRAARSVPATEWLTWQEKQSFSATSSSNCYTIFFDIQVQGMKEDTQTVKPWFSEELFPPVVFNKSTFCLHKGTCGHVKNIHEDNRLKAYMFGDEFQKLLQELNTSAAKCKELKKQLADNSTPQLEQEYALHSERVMGLKKIGIGEQKLKLNIDKINICDRCK